MLKIRVILTKILEKGRQMRIAICCISLVLSGFALVGCGQSGALQLPNDPNYDKRAKYLLYPNVEDKSSSVNKTATKSVEAPAASEVQAN